MGKTKRKYDPSNRIITPDLIEALTALTHLFKRFNDRGVIIGGIAASLLGRPRLTADLDAVILLRIEDLEKLIEAAKEEGLTVRISDAEAFTKKNRVLLLKHANSGINIDLSLGILPFEVEMVERGQKINIMGLDIRLPTAEDLIIMKSVAHRPKDLEDIRAIAESHPHLDKKRIQLWVSQFGKLLDLPGLWEEIDKLL